MTAFPNETFQGTVQQVRINPIITQNVVTYDAVVVVHDTSGRLLPGMTAQVTIDVGKRTHVPSVPIAALLYRPLAAPSGASGGFGGAFGGGAGLVQSSGAAPGAQAVAGAPGSQVTVWVLQNGRPAPRRGGDRPFGRQERRDHRRWTAAGSGLGRHRPAPGQAVGGHVVPGRQRRRQRGSGSRLRGCRRLSAGRRGRPAGKRSRCSGSKAGPVMEQSETRAAGAGGGTRSRGRERSGARVPHRGEGPDKDLRGRGVNGAGPSGREPLRFPRRVRGDHGAVRLGQVNVHAPPWVP